MVNPERVGDREPYVVYTVQSRAGPAVQRRFQDFDAFHRGLRESLGEDRPVILPPLPSKGSFGTAARRAARDLGV